ncbi:MAG: hypothetical protein EOP11_10575 [Proteobacteria bacterium]|nr:MAG: hypothetical protein EOP11_10575 [Pseudomonadota bacterium]
MKRLLSALSLFGSLSTLLCCAIPALLVSLGMGAAVAGLVTAVPQLVWLSEHKDGLFLACAICLGLAGFLRWRAENLSCPIEPALGEACRETRGWSGPLYWISVAIFGIGFFFAYIAPRIL